MKRTRLMIAAALLIALLFSSCGQAVQLAEETTAGEEALEMEIPPFRDFPPEAYPQHALAAEEGQVIPTRVESSLFHAKFEGSDVAGSGKAVGGVFHFIATETDGEAWHVKLEANYPTIAGRDYSVTYRFRSDVAGTVKFGDFQEFQIQEGDNSVTGVFTAKDSTSYLDLQLGMLPAFTIDFTEIEVKEYADEVDYENALPAPVNFERESRVYEKHDQGYGTILVRRGGVVNVNYVAAPLDPGVWKSKLFVRTGMVPEPGVRYRVTADVMCDQDMPFEVLFNDGDVEKGYGALYGQNLSANKVTVCEAVITGNGNGDELVLQFSLGNAPEGSQVIVGNVRVDKIVDHYSSVLPEGFALDTSVATGAIIEELVPVSYSNIPLSPSFYSGVDTVYEQHDDGYVVNLTEGASSATMAIVQAPANAGDRGVWKAKLYAATGVTLNPNTSYRIQFDLDSTGNQAEYEVCFDGDTENAYGALYGRSLTAGSTDHVDMLVTPDASHGPLTIRLQLGKTDSASGNTVTLKNLSVESVKLVYTDVLPAEFSYETGSDDVQEEYVNVLPDSFSYDTGVNVLEQHDDGYTQDVSADGSSATLSITEAPSEARGVWKSKLLINTGITPEAGTKYVVSFDIAADKDQAQYEVCFDGAVERKYGALFNQALSAGDAQTVSYSFVPEEIDGPIVLRFQLGNTDDASGNTITVSSLKIAAVTTGDGDSVLPDAFAYPTTNSGEAGYYPVSLPTLTAAEAHDNGYEQTLVGLSLSIGAVPSLNNEVWRSKLFVDTGTALEAGATYRVTANVTSEKAFDFELCYNNGEVEKGYGALYGQSIGAGSNSYVQEFSVPDGASTGNLVLQFQLGNSPADNSFTVSDVKLEKWEEESQKFETVPGAYEPVDISDLSASEAHDQGYTQSVNGTALTVSEVPTNGVWKSKLFVDTGTALEAGATYRVTANVTSEKAFDFELCYNNGEVEKGYGALYGQSIAAGETKDLVIEFTVAADASANNLVLQFQLGNSSAGNTFTVNKVTLEKWEEAGEAPEVSPNSFELWAHDDYKAALGGDGSSATVRFDAVPENHEVWKTKLFVFADTSVKLTAGKTYRISADVQAEQELSYEICYNDDAEEKGVGALYGLTASTTAQTVTYEVTPDADKSLIIQFSLGNASAGNTMTVSNIKVEELSETEGENLMTDPLVAWAPVHQWADAGHTTSLTNTDSSAAMAISAVAAEQADWKVKMFVETGAELEAGKRYRISYDIEADNAFDFNVFYNNGAEEKAVGDFYDLNTGSSHVEHVVTPTNDAVLNIQLMLGKSGAPNNVTVSNVQVEEIVSETDPTIAPINFWAHEDYAASLSNTGSSASIAITKVPASGREAWKVKLFAETGAELKAGKTYRVSIDMQAANSLAYDICYNNQEHEAELGAQYGLQASTGKRTVTYNITPDQDAVLILQLNLGNASGANTVTISNVKVEEVDYASAKNVIPDFRYDSVGYLSKASDDGYVTSLEKNSSSATFRITHAPSERHAWNAKVIVHTGITPVAGKGYRVSFNVDVAKPQNLFEVFYDGTDELAYGAQYEQYLSAGRNSFSYTIMPGDSKGELVLQLRFGETDGIDGNTYTISNFKVEEVAFVTTQRPEIKEACENVTQDGYTAQLAKTPGRATLRLVETPEEGLEAWKNKLFVYTGVTLEPGQKYRISFNVRSIIPTPFEVCFNNRDVEKGLAAIYGLMSKPYGEYVEYSTYVDQDIQLVIQLSLGNCTAPNTIFLSDVKVEKAGEINLVSDTVYYF